jgi:hypothetical protein
MTFHSPISFHFHKVSFNFISHKINALGTTVDTFSPLGAKVMRNTCPWYFINLIQHFCGHSLDIKKIILSYLNGMCMHWETEISKLLKLMHAISI